MDEVRMSACSTQPRRRRGAAMAAACASSTAAISGLVNHAANHAPVVWRHVLEGAAIGFSVVMIVVAIILLVRSRRP